MIGPVVASAAGLAAAGPVGGLVAFLLVWALRRFRRVRRPAPSVRVVLLILLVQLRSGLSVLASVQRAAASLPGREDLGRVARLATVAGLASAISAAEPDLRPVIAQLARAQRSGASLTSTVRRLIEQDLAAERAKRIASARSLPVRLMAPITLLMLPGLVLLLYAPALLQLFRDLTGTW